MSERAGLPIGRLIAEFGVIMIGVLVALLAESAWQERQERGEEREILEWIAEDLVQDSISLTLDRAWLGMVVPAAIDSRRILSGADSLSANARLAILYAASTIRTGAERVRTWDDLTQSGRLSIIRDPALRRALIDFYGGLAALRSDQDELPTDFRTTMISVLPTEFTRGVLADCVRAGVGPGAGLRENVAAALRTCEVTPSEEPTELLARIRAVDGVERSLGELTYDLAGSAETLEGALDSFSTLRALLDEALGR